LPVAKKETTILMRRKRGKKQRKVNRNRHKHEWLYVGFAMVCKICGLVSRPDKLKSKFQIAKGCSGKARLLPKALTKEKLKEYTGKVNG